ncbi:hypothetical protein [Lentilactobacillus kosonis]|uniref:Uncharacterized protein n=1 Tax=Lentilactobacillus kosonis TaxID=2810561 RepID=A0A401FNN7_9LACO|nr:hypothetical protein [Lentilactobacillus kosonis]GAY73878.1 hypothetical protein NBRC111893_2024 [Lentilactobacillus kosonis]
MDTKIDGTKIIVTNFKAFPSPPIEVGKLVSLVMTPPFSEKNLLPPENLKGAKNGYYQN